MKIGIIAAIAGLAALAPGMALAQNASLRPTYGQVTLTNGFSNDPQTTSLTAGGPIEASGLGGSCVGKIANAPDYQLTYTAGTTFPLFFRTVADSDTTLVVHAPDGQWYCDDDSGGGVNAQLRFGSPFTGTYQIWVGTYSDDATSATLQISELERSDSSSNTATQSTERPDPSGAPTYGQINLSSGFTPDPLRINIRAGGTAPASNASDSCSGSVATAPDYRIVYSAGSQPLIIRTQSDTDTTLLVNTPNGAWLCDDDGGDNANARLELDKPASGTYDIWVGTYSGGTSAATLILTERP